MSPPDDSEKVGQIEGVASINKDIVYDNEITYIKSEIMKKIQPQLNIGEDFGVEFLFDETKLCSGLIKIKGKKSISIFTSNDRLTLEEATQIHKNNKPLEMPRTYRFQILSIDMNSFKVISKEEVENRNNNVISTFKSDEKQGSHMDDISQLKFVISDNDDIYKVPIEFKHETVDHIVAISKPIDVDTILAEIPKQIESPAFEAKKKDLQDLKDSNKALLEGSIIMKSIETTLAKKTQSDLKKRYDDLKESIKKPVDTLNNQYTDSLKKLATDHNSVIDAQIKKTSAAASETRKKYKMAINKTKKDVEDRLAGKSKGILGSLKLKSSKLQKLEKSLDSDESEITYELAKAKRYTSIKKMLLDWSKASQDKSELTEEQIEVIVEAFKIEDYEESSKAFIENLKRNTMLIISLILEELDLKLDVFKDTAPHHLPKFLDIVKKIMESLHKMTNEETKEVDTDKVLKETIAAYALPTNNDYLTPMKLQDIKATMLAILQSSKSTSLDYSDTISEGSTATESSIISRSSVDKRRELAKNRAAVSRKTLDTFTPAINELESVISEYIPDIKSGELLLTTEREINNFLGKGTGEFKFKQYYLDVDGKVKKIDSSMTYKLAINADGSIPPQLSHLWATSNQSQSKSATTLEDINLEDVYSSKEIVSAPVESKSMFPLFSRKSSAPSLELTNSSAPSLELTNSSASASASASVKPKSSFLGSFSKGLSKLMGRKTAKDTQGVSTGGKRRTRKNRKNKTRRNKKYGRR